MEFIIKREEFLKCLLRTQGIIEKRNIKPILESVMIEVGNGKMNYRATDLEIGIVGSCDVDVISEGKITLLVSKAVEILKELSEERVSVRQKEDGNWIEILCGKSLFNIASMSPGGYPSLPAHDDIEFFSMDSKKIREMIRKTIYATSVDETRYNLSGVFWETEQNIIRMVATDGHKLSMIEKETGEKDNLLIEKGAIFPKKGLNELRRILEEDKETKEILVGFKGNNGVFKTSELLIIMRLLDGEFPDYNLLLPKDNDKKFSINREVLLASLKRVSLLSGGSSKLVKLFISKGKIELTARTPDYGEAFDEVELDYTGDDIEINFNARYFIETLSVLDSKDVLFELRDPSNPVIVKPLNDDKHICVIMPVKV